MATYLSTFVLRDERMTWLANICESTLLARGSRGSILTTQQISLHEFPACGVLCAQLKKPSFLAPGLHLAALCTFHFLWHDLPSLTITLPRACTTAPGPTRPHYCPGALRHHRFFPLQIPNHCSAGIQAPKRTRPQKPLPHSDVTVSLHPQLRNLQPSQGTT